VGTDTGRTGESINEEGVIALIPPDVGRIRFSQKQTPFLPRLEKLGRLLSSQEPWV
jgi:hypothetical protein